MAAPGAPVQFKPASRAARMGSIATVPWKRVIFLADKAGPLQAPLVFGFPALRRELLRLALAHLGEGACYRIQPQHVRFRAGHRLEQPPAHDLEALLEDVHYRQGPGAVQVPRNTWCSASVATRGPRKSLMAATTSSKAGGPSASRALVINPCH